MTTIRTSPEPVTIDPETGLPVTSLAELEAQQLAQLQETGISPYGEADDLREFPADIDTTVDDTQGYIVADGTLNIPPDILRAPTDLGGNFEARFNTDNAWWEIVDLDTGEVIQTGIRDEAKAVALAQDYSIGDPNFAGNFQTSFDEFGNPILVGDTGDTGLLPEQAEQQAATLSRAREQAALKAQQRQVNRADWRVRLTLADSANYLYADPSVGYLSVLYPLKASNGVVFPYTPRISTGYRANYDQYNLTHSNYRGYFYQNSYMDPVSITATFTAQDTSEANYILAVIHFFRAVTKMFYGANDPLRGTPPPLVFLRGLGQYQFNQSPCVVSSFSYNLPDDVDYIRAGSANTAGLQDLNYRRNRAALPSNVFSSAIERLANAGLPKGAEGNSTNRLNQPDRVINTVPTFGTDNPTYVPTKIEIEIELLPLQTRQQISKEFTFDDYAAGTLIKKGFW
jgi:hypothetical protein